MLPVVNNMRQPQVITKVSVSTLVISLPILYVSLLRLPPSTLAGDTTFWFLMSNSIIAIIAADSGMLFFRPASPPSGDDNDGDGDGAGDQPAVAVEEEGRDALPPASSGVPESTVDVSDLVGGQPLQMVDGVVSCRAERDADMEMKDHLLALIKLEESGEAPARGPATDMNDSLVVRDKEGEGDVAIEPTTKRSHGEEQDDDDDAVGSEPNRSLLEDGGGGDELVAIDYGYASAEVEEPWRRPRLVTSKNVGEEDERDQWAPPLAPEPPDDSDKRIVVGGDEGRLQRSTTEGSRRSAEEEQEYWQLNDEDLNRRVEEFIARFNREMRLQIEQEAAGVLLCWTY